jgi:hypothetical protein
MMSLNVFYGNCVSTEQLMDIDRDRFPVVDYIELQYIFNIERLEYLPCPAAYA